MEKQKVGIWKQNDEGDWYTPRIPENQKLFNELMKRTPYKGDDWDENSVFTDEEIEFLGRFNLPEFGKKFPNEGEYYMDELS